ncbi:MULTISPECIES: NUDIX hydrolase [Streptomyces]|uniref:NUDIX hydrolase n=1 Tax=Streptomyces doudnae TaxID=3075536 RepID=A0ABD5EVB5_9ACTN|nr:MULTISPECIES: NUDIX hydrolase [unclassified Streptomyces]MDT0438598.1 NUDIX hydrolase [Streptomyces sp. DSM 41981]MYQ65761.1 NUDIX domain-containing protein [Streptomyces sp. SID4950]SCE07124.1 8-oxo-dGTP diphosphatase [Streptomyces sp. SolWspMP-5a-2]
MTSTHDTLVRAAGCVLWRRASGQQIELALVYRPRWADWSWPKGKLKRDETHEAAARREVLEETGHTCRLGAPLPAARYVDHQRRPKEVRYWVAEATGGTFTPNAEVSDLVWLTPEQARRRISRPRDRDLIATALHAIAEEGAGGSAAP